MENIETKFDGVSVLPASQFNNYINELKNIILSTNQALTAADVTQIAKSMANYVINGNFFTDSGLADAYILSVVGTKLAPTEYVDGFTVSFQPGNANTGASTINVSGLGVKNIKKNNGANDLVSGDLTTSMIYTLVYRLSGDYFELLTVAPSVTPPPTQQVFTSSGTYVKPAGLKFAFIEVQGAGGGGGGTAPTTVAGNSMCAAGGGSGAYRMAYVAAGSIAASETVTVGTAGAGGGNTGTNGVAGGASSFGTLISCTGGGGGTGATVQSSTTTTGATPGGAGGGSSGLGQAINGIAGQTGVILGGGRGIGGMGAASRLSHGNISGVNSASGVTATGFGGGGGGACSGSVGGTDVGRLGGTGSAGIVIVWEYY